MLESVFHLCMHRCMYLPSWNCVCMIRHNAACRVGSSLARWLVTCFLTFYCNPYFLFKIFKLGACSQGSHTFGFLKLLLLMHQYVCVCLSVCLPLRALITSGVKWCDIGCVQLVKQVLRFLLLSIILYDTCHR